MRPDDMSLDQRQAAEDVQTEAVLALRRALAASGMSSNDYARRILGRTPRNMRRWLDGTQQVPDDVIAQVKAGEESGTGGWPSYLVKMGYKRDGGPKFLIALRIQASSHGAADSGALRLAQALFGESGLGPVYEVTPIVGSGIGT